ncbi:MAG: methyltransferase domain-containing protein [Phycisphaerales bacterium]|nr:MAG: methyltransferase domain-containing protein [Phycisphaerales bacterium]
MHSCLLVSSQKKALEYPRGGLQLSFCHACGFIANTRFDGTANNYCTEYEETQGFSPRFRAFAKSLAERLIEKYDIRGKSVLEIGCGKGEFLALMCELGDNRGIGIDPAYVPERNPSRTTRSINFIQDFYSEAYADLEVDVICCRHTLEHIAPTYAFMDMIRRAIGDRRDVLVLFEVPDVIRVLKEGAFWDIYYEHCTYFSAGSLARLFRASRFEIDDLYLDYDGQYIILAAYPGESSIGPASEIENDLGDLSRAFERFRQTCSDRLVHWRNTIDELTAAGQRTVLWGSGSKAVAFLTTLGITDEIEYVVDINPYKRGRFTLGAGQEIVSPEFLTRYRPDKVIVMNPIYCDEIGRNLDQLGVRAELLPL